MSTDQGRHLGGTAPLYSRVAARIRADLDADQAAPGTHLPSERVLSERYGTSRVTIRSALAELREAGVLHSVPARGWLVTEHANHSLDLPAQRVRGFTDLATELGMTATSKVLSSKVRGADQAEAQILRISPGAALFELRRVRFLDGLPIAVEHNRLPLAICPVLREVDFERTSLYATLRASTSHQPRRAAYSVIARNPTPEEAELLAIAEPVPLLVATQLTYNQNGEPIEYTLQSYRGDRYTFQASITG